MTINAHAYRPRCILQISLDSNAAKDVSKDPRYLCYSNQNWYTLQYNINTTVQSARLFRNISQSWIYWTLFVLLLFDIVLICFDFFSSWGVSISISIHQRVNYTWEKKTLGCVLTWYGSHQKHFIQLTSIFYFSFILISHVLSSRVFRTNQIAISFVCVQFRFAISLRSINYRQVLIGIFVEFPFFRTLNISALICLLQRKIKL